MDKLHNMKETIVNFVQKQMTNLETVDTKELGEAIDIIKDLAEAMYYCTITEAMTGNNDKHYYSPKYRPPNQRYPDDEMPYEDWCYDGYCPPIWYADKEMRKDGHRDEMWENKVPAHDEREGRSHLSRRTYMETKEMHSDKNVKLKELEKYMQELTTDMVDMIQGASPEEKQLLEKRITALATKIGQTNV